jgi:hypothetical protein
MAAWFFCGCGQGRSEYGASEGISMPLPVARPASLLACGMMLA